MNVYKLSVCYQKRLPVLFIDIYIHIPNVWIIKQHCEIALLKGPLRYLSKLLMYVIKIVCFNVFWKFLTEILQVLVILI